MTTILKSALIITMDEERRILNGASLVMENDRICYIGPDEGVKNAADVVVDCKGKVLLPGFVNTHTHQILSIIRGVAEDMGTAPAYTHCVPQGYQLSQEESHVMALLGAAEALRFGSTYLVDMYTNCFASARAFDQIGIKASVCEMVHDMDFSTIYKGEYRRDDALGEELLERNVRLLESWETHPRIEACVGLHAPDTCSEGFIKKVLDVRERYDAKLATHLAQSRGEAKRVTEVSGGLSPVEFYGRLGVLGGNTLAAHCIYVNDRDIDLLQKTRTNVVHIPEGNAKGGMAAPLKKLLERQMNVCLGTDNGSADMLEVMRMGLCVCRVLSEGFSVMPMDLLEMATINGAKAIGKDKELGSLEIGKKADILVLDFRKPHLIPCLNPVGTLLHTGLGSDIEQVFVNGKKVVDNGRLLTVDEDALLREAQKIAERKWLAVNDRLNADYFLKL